MKLGKNYWSNTLYLFGGKLVFLILEVLVGLMVARYFGPEIFGRYSYILAIYSIFLAVGKTGLEPIVVKHLILKPSEPGKIIGSALTVRIVISSILSILCLIMYILNYNDALYLFILSLAIVPSSFNILNSFFQANVEAKYQVFSETISKIVSSILKFVVVLADGKFIHLIIVVLVEQLMMPTITLLFYKAKSDLRWQFDRVFSMRLIRDSVPVLLSGIIVILHMRIDQIMIRNMIDSVALGYYSAAIRLSESWYFIPGVLATSLFPRILSAKEEDLGLESVIRPLYTALIYVSIFIAIVTTLFSAQIVYVLYGSQYEQSAVILSYYIWSGIFVSINYVSLKHYHVLNLENYKLLFTIISLLVNIVSNYILIRTYGLVGAAASTLVSLGFTSVVLNFFFKRTQEVGTTIIRSMSLFALLKIIPEFQHVLRKTT